MGTFLFILVKATHTFDTPYDYAILSVLVSLDVQTIFRAWVYWRSRR